MLRPVLTKVWWISKPFLCALALVTGFDVLGKAFLSGFPLDLGSETIPHQRETLFLFYYGTLGTAAAAFAAVGLARLAGWQPRVSEALSLFPKTPDKNWIAFVSLAAFLIPLSIRMLALEDAAVADDESCYHFGAQLVASGRLWVPSPPMKLFFDRTFMINDGKLYPMYFMGWPILMAPGVKLGVAGYMNAVYSALTVPALFYSARKLAGSSAARATILLYVASPMLMIAAATQMSNTTCIAALAWMLAAYLHARDEASSLLGHVGVALFFGLAVLIRPPSAMGVGIPVLAAWAWLVLRGPADQRVRRVLAFAVPAAATAAVFFGINKAQNGAYGLISYLREFQYAKENGLRFNNWGAPGLRENINTLSPHFWPNRPIFVSLAVGFAGLFRLNFNLFGWAPSLLFVPFAIRRPGGRLLGAMAASYFLMQYGVTSPGIDVYGPHHYMEVALPFLLCSAIGVHACAVWLRERFGAETAPDAPPALKWHLLPGALALALTTLAMLRYVPPRMRALSEIAADVNGAKTLLDAHGVHNAVVFTSRPFTARFAVCQPRAASHFVYWRPNNDPDLTNDILWVNHITVDDDTKLMETLFQGRAAYVQWFDDACRRNIVSLDMAKQAGVPDGDVDGVGTGIVGLKPHPAPGKKAPAP